MLRWALIFLIIALVAALFGFTGIAAAAAGIAKFLFFWDLIDEITWLEGALDGPKTEIQICGPYRGQFGLVLSTLYCRFSRHLSPWMRLAGRFHKHC